MTDSDGHEPIRVAPLFQLGWYRWLPLSAIDFEELLHRFPGISRRGAVQAQRVWDARRAGVVLDDSLAPDVLADSMPAAPAWPAPGGPTDEPGDEQAYAEELADRRPALAAGAVRTRQPRPHLPAGDERGGAVRAAGPPRLSGRHAVHEHLAANPTRRDQRHRPGGDHRGGVWAVIG